jgi:glycosyltransferase involved in cell wall biosynthesis
MTPKKILFISYDGMTDPLGQSQVIPYLAGLSKFRYEFTILSCDKPDRYKKYKTHIVGILKPYSINWVSIPYHKKPPLLSSVYDFYNLKHKAARLHKHINFDMVHTRPGVPALVGLWMKQKWGIKFLNDIREFYADSRVEGGMWNTKEWMYRTVYNFFKTRETEAVANNDGIVCLTHAAEKIIELWPQYKKEIPVEVIPCSVDLELFDPEKIDLASKNKFKEELAIKDDDFVISYLGSIGSWYLTDEVMQFCKVISDRIPKAKFLFISFDKNGIRKAADELNLSEKITVRYAQRHEVPILLSFSKYSLFFIKPCYSKISSSPTRHGEIMAMGIPVITNAGVGDVEQIVDKYKAGIVLKQLNKNEFLKAADTLASDITFDKNIIRRGAQDFYALGNAVYKYSKLYQQILNNNSSCDT